MNRRARPQLSSPCPDACMRPSPRLPPRLPRHKQGPTATGSDGQRANGSSPQPPTHPGPTPIAPYKRLLQRPCPWVCRLTPLTAHATHPIPSPPQHSWKHTAKAGCRVADPPRFRSDACFRRCQTSSSAPSSYASSNPASSQPASSSAPSAWQRPWPPAWPPAWPQA